MALGFDEFLSRLDIPNFDGAVASTRQQFFTFGVERHGTNAAGIGEGVNPLSRLHVPDDGLMAAQVTTWNPAELKWKVPPTAGHK